MNSNGRGNGPILLATFVGCIFAMELLQTKKEILAATVLFQTPAPNRLLMKLLLNFGAQIESTEGIPTQVDCQH